MAKAKPKFSKTVLFRAMVEVPLNVNNLEEAALTEVDLPAVRAALIKDDNIADFNLEEVGVNDSAAWSKLND